MRTYRDNYLTGRKHCSCCTRWRPVSDFAVRLWADEPLCTMPRLLGSVCLCCSARKRRQKTGYKLRNWYPNGTPGSERYRQHINAHNRASAKRRYADPQKRAEVNEYHRIWRHAKTGAKARGKPKQGPLVLVDAQPLLDWADAFAGTLTLSEHDRHQIRIWRAGEHQPDLGTVDRIMTANGAYDQVAVLYPLDEELSVAA